jgi:hypothetical protein
MEMWVNISFEDFLLMLNLDLLPYIDSLCNKLTMPTLLFKRKVKHIKTNVYAIKVAPLWEANSSTIYSWPMCCSKLLHIIFDKDW